MEGKGGQRGGRFFFVFNRKRKRKWKIFCTFCRKSFKDSKTVFFFHSSIKTEEVLFFYIYIYKYLHIFVYIYKKLSPKWKNCHEQKVFLFLFYILCEKFSKIEPIIKNFRAKGVHRGSKFDVFQCLAIFIIYSFIHLIYSYFSIFISM